MKKTNIFLILYVIATILFIISGFLPHISVVWEASGDLDYVLEGFEFYAAPFFVIAFIFLLISKIKIAFFFYLIGCLIYGPMTLMFYGPRLSLDSMQTEKIYIFYQGFYLGILSYVFLIILIILMLYIYNFKEIAKEWGLIPDN